MTKEYWKTIQGQRGRYEVSSFGRVRSFCRYPEGRVLALSLRRDGYECVTLWNKNGTFKSYLIHRLVARALLSRRSSRPEVNHRDGNKTNNRLQNLEWSTRSENISHGYRTGLIKPYRGERNPNAKLRVTEVKKIRTSYAAGDVTQSYLATLFGVSQGLIGQIVNRRIWREI